MYSRLCLLFLIVPPCHSILKENFYKVLFRKYTSVKSKRVARRTHCGKPSNFSFKKFHGYRITSAGRLPFTEIQIGFAGMA